MTNNKYLTNTQRAGVILGSYVIIKLLVEKYMLPITVFEEALGISVLLFVYIYLLKSYWVDSNYAFREGSYVGMIYTIIGIPFVLIVVAFVMFTMGWLTIPMKSYKDNYDNNFDRIVVVYISPIVSILMIGYIVINNL